ncbi:Aldehyde dehydrogenase NAD(P)-dependent [Carpediemonas membranifera]|uniref:Aldehyde dehydrogenase n=1 Tax=Carpediemonas membranifera TaxID=201153 RepID=A0A8J6ARB3_9EUKA|nr:Aldehyde dehydrogenase NAD(P)-dependent [Carpediemonas membranifera]|eukprot:KAG9392311.1 Aldehyde dehydrogenase NAD(P)-dependent [Carpediemonas membranifera]
MADSSIQGIYDALKSFERTREPRSIEWRRAQLKALKHMLSAEKDGALKALKEDLGRCDTESIMEYSTIVSDVSHILSHLPSLVAPQSVERAMLHWPCEASIVTEPLGTVLIISPWNYPLSLALQPLVGALAAGNCAVIKPSEVATACEKWLVEAVPRYLDKRAVAVVPGGVEVSTELLKLHWDHIFYTGNSVVARIVMRAAAEHLTPVTLELGGKSPVVVANDADMRSAARKLLWGKHLNCGQTCVGPDYVLTTPDAFEPLSAAFKAEYAKIAPSGDLKESKDYPRIINHRHTERLAGLVAELPETIVGSTSDIDVEAKYIPIIVAKVDKTHPLMDGEIFGPILPIIVVDSIDESIDYINSRDKPLALYAFTKSKKTWAKILGSTSSGGAACNDVIVHLSHTGLPFGGVGESGMGNYHGDQSYHTFSHHRSVLKKGSIETDKMLRYPPYKHSKMLDLSLNLLN